MKPSTAIGLLAAAASLAACGGGSSTPAPVSTLGTLGVSLTDAPACGFEAVNVTVTKVRVNKSATASDTDAGWTDIALSPARKINLLDLTNGVLQDLGSATLEAGHYSQIRLLVDPNASGTSNTVVPAGGTAQLRLDTPSALQGGIKVNGEFVVVAGQKSDIVLDFDACRSVIKSSAVDFLNYRLDPVVKMVPSALNGIDGYVASAALANHVMVSAQQNGKVIGATAADPVTGEFLLARLPVGNYDVVITSDNSAAAVIGAVPVSSATSTTVVATRGAPITLAASAMGWIGGMVKMTPPSDTPAWLAAKQSFAGGPTVTVAYTSAEQAIGAYVIGNLPMAPPQYAAYSATLPLAFGPGAGPALGKYTVEASAVGYMTRSVDGVDSTPAPLRTDFMLVP